MKLSEMRDARAGEVVLVCGGGPSLPGDLQLVLERLPVDPTPIAVKQHALFLQDELGFQASYCCFLEDPDAPDQSELRTALRLSPEVVKVAPFARWSDVEFDEPWWNGGFSSSLATWLAGWMGAERILLCGMDCYQGAKKYFYERPRILHACIDSPVENHIAAWRPVFDYSFAVRIRAVSGPLVQLFGSWLP